MEYTFNITQEIIDATPRYWTHAMPGDKPTLDTFIDDDPLEIAIRQQSDIDIRILSDCKHMEIYRTDWNWSRVLPIGYNRAVDFCTRWRTNKSVKPFEFKLEI